jgi:hypothetical protein
MMARPSRQEARALTSSERALVENSRSAVLKILTDRQLGTLVKRLRERRDRARTVADRQRRELRGKAPARGATAATANDGSERKLAVLAAALKRLDTESERRHRAKAKAALIGSARKALALKDKAARKAAPSTKAAPSQGLRGTARTIVKNHVPGSTRGRARKQVARAQAKRDARP